MKATICANALIIIDDAQTFLIIFQVMDKGRSRQWLFQIVQTPAFIDLIEIGRLALGPLPNFKLTLGFEKAQDIIALLHCFFQICRSAFADGKLIVVPNQPMQPLQCPKPVSYTHLHTGRAVRSVLIVLVCAPFVKRELPPEHRAGPESFL